MRLLRGAAATSQPLSAGSRRSDAEEEQTSIITHSSDLQAMSTTFTNLPLQVVYKPWLTGIPYMIDRAEMLLSGEPSDDHFLGLT